MVLQVCLIGIFFIIVVFLIVFVFIINEIRNGRYKVTEDSILEKEAENKYEILYPNNSINDLKSEIEKVAELLINGEESNRYTEALRIKARKR